MKQPTSLWSQQTIRTGRVLPNGRFHQVLIGGRGLSRTRTPNRPDWSQGAFLRKLFGRANSSDAEDAVGEAAKGTAEQPEVTKGDSTSVSEVEQPEEGKDNETEDGDPFGLEELFKEIASPKNLGRRGEGWVLAQIVSVLLIIFPPLNLSGLIGAVGWISLAGGVVVILSGLMALGRSLSPFPYPREGAKLIKDGMYAQVRHPIYGGLLMGAFGWSLITGSEVRCLLTGLLWWVLESKVKIEEKALEEVFPDYAEYKSGVKKFFPFVY